MKRITNINVFTIDGNNHAMIEYDNYSSPVNYSSNVTLYNFISNELMCLEKNIETINSILPDKDGASDA